MIITPMTVVLAPLRPRICKPWSVFLSGYLGMTHFPLFRFEVPIRFEGEPEEKMTILAAREGFKAGVGLIADETVGKQVSEAISNSVQTTARSLSNSGTFSAVTSAMNQSGQGMSCFNHKVEFTSKD
jgi:hypothetical protein